MNLDLSFKGIAEKVVTALVLSLIWGAWGMYQDVTELLAMKDDLKVVQQYLACPDCLGEGLIRQPK